MFKELKDKNYLNTKEFSFIHIDKKEVKDYIHDLANNSSPGVSGIPTKVIKYCINAIIEPLVKIFNACISSSCIPSECTCVVVTPFIKIKVKKIIKIIIVVFQFYHLLLKFSKKFYLVKLPIILNLIIYFSMVNMVLEKISRVKLLYMNL